MKHKATVVVGALCSLGMMASPAVADNGDDSVPPPDKFQACGTTVTVTTLVDETKGTVIRENARKTVTRFTGKLVLRITAQDGRRISRLDVSGPATVTEHKNGRRLEVKGTGRNFFSAMSPSEAREFREEGLPKIFFEQGPYRVVEKFDKQGNVTDVRVAGIGKVTSVCKLLDDRKRDDD